MRHATPWLGAIIAVTPVAVACGTPCGDTYAAGTRLTVTVTDAFDDCHVTFTKGQVYELVAKRASERGDGCEMNRAEGLPVFASSEIEPRHCQPDQSPMGIQCVATIPSCPDMSTTRISLRATYSNLPDEPGEAVATTLRLAFSSVECSDLSCTAAVPVVVRW